MFGYDALDRMIAEHWVAGGDNFSYSYDAVGNMTGASDAYGNYAMQYDNLNLPRSRFKSFRYPINRTLRSLMQQLR